VFVKGELVVRALSVKEACQLLDVPGTWPTKETVRNMWTWNQGQPCPLRLQVEFLLRSSKWLARGGLRPSAVLRNQQLPAVNNVSQLLLQTRALEEVGDTGLFRLFYFRWVCEPQSPNEVSVASAKADDAGVD
jgi:hypothetical protein